MIIKQVDQVLNRAHALFGDPPSSGGTAAAGTAVGLADAGTTVRSAQTATTGLSGRFATNYSRFGMGASQELASLSRTDGSLSTLLRAAADDERAGRAASGSVVHGAADDIARLAPFADTPAGQRTLIAALRNRMAQQHEIVQEHNARGNEVAASIRTLNYEPGTHGDETGLAVEPASAGNVGAAPKSTGIQPMGYGIAPPLTPPDPQLPVPPPGLSPAPVPLTPPAPPLPGPPTPTLSPPRGASVPEPLRDFTDYQRRNKAAPPYVPPVTGEPIKRPPTPPQPIPVIDLNLDPGGGLFTRCDGGDVAKAWAEIAGGLFGAVGAVSITPFTGGASLVGLGAAGTAIGIGGDDLYNCK
jgi:hypothetical protein